MLVMLFIYYISNSSVNLHFVNFIFFLCYGDHRDLHSFPTRRSSDLPADFETEDPYIVVELDEACRRQQLGERSEEHTSELQSLRHLVCRLLLEKKKIPFCYLVSYS